MAEKFDGGMAFPRTSTMPELTPQVGMTLRDYFAAHALIALGDHKAVTARGIPWLAEHAYMVADAMLAIRAGAPPVIHREAHMCYRPGCGQMTTLGTAWCQKCLDDAREERLKHPPMKPRPRPPLPRPRRSK